jgi:hypothetical protein
MFLPHITFADNSRKRPRAKNGPKYVGSLTYHPLPSSPNFGELRKSEVHLRRIRLPRTPVNKKSVGDFGPYIREFGGLLVAE